MSTISTISTLFNSHGRLRRCTLFLTIVIGVSGTLHAASPVLDQSGVFGGSEYRVYSDPSIARTADRDHYWIGLSDPTPGTYVWDSGEAFSFQDWHSGEPTQTIGNEVYAALDYRNSSGEWAWNDLPNNSFPSLQKGFVAERAVPEPSLGLALMCLGASVGLRRIRSRRNR